MYGAIHTIQLVICWKECYLDDIKSLSIQIFLFNSIDFTALSVSLEQWNKYMGRNVCCLTLRDFYRIFLQLLWKILQVPSQECERNVSMYPWSSVLIWTAHFLKLILLRVCQVVLVEILIHFVNISHVPWYQVFTLQVVNIVTNI